MFKPDDFYCVQRFKENRRIANRHYQQRVAPAEATATVAEVPEWIPHTPEHSPEPSDTSGEEWIPHTPEPSDTSGEESGNERIIDLT